MLGIKPMMSALVFLGGIGAPLYLALKKQCYAMNANVLLKQSLHVSEPILECTDNALGKSYTVFLELKKSSNKQEPYLKVVDNKTKLTKWSGPNNGSNTWADWAIQIYKDQNDKNYEGDKTSIRVPKDGENWRQGEAISILCQMSQLQLKRDGKEGQCAGSYLRATKLQMTMSDNNITISANNKFDWKDEFRNKPIFCTS